MKRGRLSSLEFAHPQLSLRQRSPLTGWGLLVAALLLAAWLLHDTLHWQVRHEAAQAALRQQAGAHAADRPLSATQSAEIRFAEEVLRQGATPWEALFGAIESARPADIAILRLHAQGRSREVRLSGEARHFDALTAFLAALDRQADLAGSQLLHHQVEEGRGTVKFDVLVRWKSP